MQPELPFDQPAAASETVFGEWDKERLARKRAWAGELAAFLGREVVVRLKYHRDPVEGKFEALGPDEFSIGGVRFDRALLETGPLVKEETGQGERR